MRKVDRPTAKEKVLETKAFVFSKNVGKVEIRLFVLVRVSKIFRNPKI